MPSRRAPSPQHRQPRQPRRPRDLRPLIGVLAVVLVVLVGVAVTGRGGGTSSASSRATAPSDRPSRAPGHGTATTTTATTTAADAPTAAASGRGASGAIPATAANGLRCRAPSGGRPIVTHGPRTGERRVALTLDDGPSIYTPGILRALRRVDARATFFEIGRQIGPERAFVRRVLADGHALGSHTWSHADVSAGGAVADQQMNDTQDAIQRAVGRAGCLMRPPRGSVGPGLERWLRVHRKLGILWDVDSQDYEGRSADEMVPRIVAAARPGSIILMHDGGGDRRPTIAAVPRIVRGLRARGLQPVTVPELLELPAAR